MVRVMSESMEKLRTPRLLMVAVVLFCLIILLQLGLMLQRHLNRPSAGAGPDVNAVWTQADEIEFMHARINRLFDQAFRSTLSVPQPPAAVTNAPIADGSAVSFEDAFAHMRRMQRQIDELFDQGFERPAPRRHGFDEGWSRLQVTPGFNVQDKESAYEVAIRLPGIDKSGIQITLNGSVLSIVAQQESRNSSRHFERHLRLPGATSDQGKIRAIFTNELLSITIPRENQPGLAALPINVH